MKRLFIVFLLLLCFKFVYASEGNGGPVSTVCYTNFQPVNDFLAGYSIPSFDPQYYLIGGVGTSWLIKSFGVGFSVVAGSQLKLRSNYSSYASIRTLLAFISMENLLFESKVMRLSSRLGPGVSDEHLTLVSAGKQTEYVIDSMLLHLGICMQFKLSSIMLLEVSTSYLIVPTDEWVRLTGNEPEPANTRFDGYNASLALRFGSSYSD